VTAADVQALAAELFTPARYGLALVGPYEDEAEWVAFIQGLAA
jgi:predicted Zn-dependent peptidase